MTLYKDNPNLKLQTKVTVLGDCEYRINCKYIQGKYYTINRDVFEVDDKWYRKESRLIEFDAETKKWVLKNSTHLISGVVDFVKGEPVLGKFSPNPFNNCMCNIGGKQHVVISPEILNKTDYVENIIGGDYYTTKGLSSNTISSLKKIKTEGNFQHKGYNIEDNAEEFKIKKDLYAQYDHKQSVEVRSFGKLLGNITYGLEIEASEGNIPNHLQSRTGLVACRDGSINSAEWVTVPMSGSKGLQNIKEIGEILKPRCNVDINCSLHEHIGNIPLDRQYICALYILGLRLQDSIYKMFPYFKTDPRGIKKKNYCQKLKNLNINPCKDFSREGFKEYIESVYYNILYFCLMVLHQLKIITQKYTNILLRISGIDIQDISG